MTPIQKYIQHKKSLSADFFQRSDSPNISHLESPTKPIEPTLKFKSTLLSNNSLKEYLKNLPPTSP